MKRMLLIASVVLSIIGFTYTRSTSAQGTVSPIGPGVSATNNLGQTFVPGVGTFTFNENVWDTGNIHSETINPTRFYAPSTGFYLVNLTALTTSNGASFQLFFQVNGADIEGTGVGQGSATGNMNTGAHFSEIVYMNAGDYIEGRVYAATTFTTIPYYDGMQVTKLSSTF